MVDINEKLSCVKGMSDVLPEQSVVWQYVENKIRKITASYAYNEIRTPILERTPLFKRSIGEVTDIVEKEMFSFPDQNGDSLTLRPEGTASCVRACIEHSLLRNQQQQKLWYMGPMFRYERPQKGRYRQFSQLGVEAFNFTGPDVDVEQIALFARLAQELGISDMLSLQINSLGDVDCRQTYRQTLVKYFSDHLDKLDADCKRRLNTNPLRILDSKNPEMQEIILNAPILLDFLDPDSKMHFAELQQELNNLGIAFTINPRIVRGLDYYNRSVYEWVTDHLGSQSAVCAGGRYDSLVEMLGGPKVPAVGFAVGLERLLLLLEIAGRQISNAADGFLLCVGAAAEKQRLVLAESIRDYLPGFALQTSNGTGHSIASLFKKADKSRAKVALVIGDDELAANTVSIKFLREDRPQQTIALTEINKILGDI